jgi:CO/xanthine dehydrogenase Mo-binding subunit
VPAADLRVRDGTIAAADGRQVSYWDLAGQGLARLDVPVTTRATPKRPSEYAVVGKSIPRPDLWAKVRGEAFFLQDMRPPGMLHGRVVMPETYGAMLLEVDVVAAKNMPGVIAVVRDASFLGVVAEREEQAIAARAQLLTSARWSAAPVKLPMGSPLAEQLKTWKSEDTVIDAAGQDTPAPQATLQHQASYSRPYLSHASVGPSCALAHMHEGRMTVWSHTQGAYPLRGDLATVLGLPADKVDVVHVPGSGCYGHNGADDVALDAALLARAVDGRPVRVQWMRADEFACSPLGPAMAITIKAALDAEGKLVDWDYEVWSNSHAMRPGQPGGINLLAAQRKSRPAVPSQPLRIPQPFGDGDRNAVTLYRVPRRKTTNHLLLQAPIRSSSLRTLGGHGNMFAIECFMDELAALSGQDPVAFRKAHLSDSRALAVIDAVAQRAAWQPGFKSAAGKGRGFAYARYKNVQTYAAVVADIAVDKTSGLIRVEKIFAAIDVGRAINPDGVKSQIEGGILQAISWTLKEQVGFDAERITSRDWGSYPVMRCSEMPVVEMILIDRPEEQPLGAGEGALGPASAAVANALANAGVRLRDLPLSAERVRGAMNQ